MPLTVNEIKNLKPKAKPYKRGDEKGLYLEVMPSGAKYWRFKYRRPGSGKESRLGFGTWKARANPTASAPGACWNGACFPTSATVQLPRLAPPAFWPWPTSMKTG